MKKVMFRLNIVPVYELKDFHLKSEYRSIPRVEMFLKRTIRSKKGLLLDKLPKNYIH